MFRAHQRTGHRLARSHRAELEAIAGEGERACAIAIGGVLEELRQQIDTDAHRAGLLGRMFATTADGVENVRQLIPQEDRDDRRRRLVGTQTMIVGGKGHHGPQQVAVHVHGTNHRGTKDQKLGIILRAIARIEQIAQAAAERPVDVFARAVDPREGLLVQQAGHAVLLGRLLQQQHRGLLMIRGQIGVFEQRSELVLRRSHFVVASFCGHAQLEHLLLGIQHEVEHAVGDHAEVVILEFLPFGRLGAVQRAAASHQVRTGKIEIAVDQEVLLLGAARRHHRVRNVMAHQL